LLIITDGGFVKPKYEEQLSGNHEWPFTLTCNPSYKASCQGRRSLR